MQEAADILSSAATSPSPSNIATTTETPQVNTVAVADAVASPLATVDVTAVPADEQKKRSSADSSITGLYVRRNVRAALSSLFSQKELSSADGDEDSSSSSPDQMTVEQLLAQNAMLKSRIAFLETEMGKAKDVLMQVGNSSSI